MCKKRERKSENMNILRRKCVKRERVCGEERERTIYSENVNVLFCFCVVLFVLFVVWKCTF